MATVQRFEDLVVWKLARELYQNIAHIIEEKKQKMDYAFIRQIDSSSGSIMDNIAEGFERGNRKEFIQFLGYAKGSCGELRSQTYRMRDKQLISEEEFQAILNLCQRTSNLIFRLMTKLQQSSIPGSRHK
ncbi:MAG: four helix bundle protein [Sphingobacteriales bacterium]|jgi:four helix bundle protein|nr:four helix bundle protein [Sphingobacteriales bacterium]NCT73299.1 four helix bundle protein [Chitinophagaceae bacterium]OJW35208.1 MAG: hypothetical protein BGO54_03440 [Sphingobacteriales bacterium 46-32]